MNFKSTLLCAALLPVSLSALASENNDSQVNPLVVAKAVEMGKYLRSLNKVEVTAQTTHDVVLDSGIKVQATGTSQMVADGKNRLYVNIDTDNMTREYFFNGKQLTQYSPTLQFYTSVDMKGSSLDMLGQVEQYYGLHLPLKALYLLGSEQSDLSKLTLANYVGPSKVNGKVCDHLLFSQPGLDWQLWVSKNDKKPLPCKLVITKTDESSQPQTSQTFTWDLAPKVSANEFTFKPAKGDVAIQFKKIAE